MNEIALIDYWSSVRDIVDKTCAEYDVLWQKRNRILNTKIILIMIFKITACKRHYGLSSNLTEFWDICADKNIDLPQEKPIAASSFCEARQKLSEDIFKDLNRKLLTNWEEKRCLHRWFGHRIFAIDGSRINLPRELTAYGYNIYDDTRRHYPQGLLSCLYDVLNKTVYDVDFVSHMNERKCALQHLNAVQPNDIVIFDRGYFSYLMLHEFNRAGVHALFRLQEGSVNKHVEAFIASAEMDLTIDYIPSATVISDLKKQGYTLKPIPIPLRLIKHMIKGETYLYGTTLLDIDQYPALGLAELYYERWDIEELYKISKHIIDIEVFHSKTERGIKQEMYAHLLLINLSRFFEFDAKDDLPPMSNHDKEECAAVNFYKLFNPTSMFNVNFKNCLSIVGRYIENLVLAAYDQLEKWTPKVIHMILRVRQKIRPGRSYPRHSHKPAKKWSAKGKETSARY